MMYARLTSYRLSASQKLREGLGRPWDAGPSRGLVYKPPQSPCQLFGDGHGPVVVHEIALQSSRRTRIGRLAAGWSSSTTAIS